MMQWFNRNSLFWKIFFAFWFANLMVILTTSYFTFEVRHSSDLHEQKQRFAESMGKEMLRNLSLDPSYYKKHRRHFLKARLESSSGALLADTLPPAFAAGERKAKKIVARYGEPPALEKFSFVDAEGTPFQVFLPARMVSPELRKHFKHLFAFRLTLLFIASGLVSYLLSRLIIGPLMRLGEQAAVIRQGGEMKDFDSKLLARKDEIGDLARCFNEAMWAVSSMIEARQTLLHDVSHEMRAPLARFAATIGLLEQQGECRREVQRLQKEYEKMTQLVDQVLTYSRVEGGTPSYEPLDLAPFLLELIENTRYEFSDHRICYEGGCEQFIFLTDKRLLQVVVGNLLRNACQHTPLGSEVRVAAQRQQDTVVISVEDNGLGVAHDQLNELFKPFFRLQYGNKKSPGGKAKERSVGLGLNIVQRAVARMQGTVRVQNKPTGGLRFEVELPIANQGDGAR